MKKTIFTLGVLLSYSVFADNILIAKLGKAGILCSFEKNNVQDILELSQKNPFNHTLSEDLLRAKFQLASCEEESEKLISDSVTKSCKDQVATLLNENKICSFEVENLVHISMLFEREPTINGSIDFESSRNELRECIELARSICL